MTASWKDLFDRAAATDGTLDIERIRTELERRRQRDRSRGGDADA
ncbi:hypothetical protein [Halomontanus rarus]|nr:hypothetical protein [Halovivax sp. TS33]